MATSTLGNGTLVLAGTTSGTTTVTATAVAGTTTLTLPAATDTLVGKATTDTLTNKTLTAPTLTSPNITTALTLTGAAGTSGQVLTSAGTGAAPTWTTAGASAATPNALGTIYGKTDTSSLVFLGYQAGNSNTGTNNTAIGIQAGYSNTSGTENTYIGPYSGYYVTTGSKNTVIGRYSALNAPISQTGSNFIVLSDGDGNVGAYTKTGQTFVLPSGTISSGTGIAFPATQSASSDANTLDDYEEGTWTPSLGGTATYSAQLGQYIKIGRQVTVMVTLQVSTLGTGSTTTISGLPFATNATAISGNAVAKFTTAVNVIGLNALALDGSVTTIRFTYISASGTTNTYDPALFGNSTAVYFSLTYFVN